MTRRRWGALLAVLLVAVFLAAGQAALAQSDVVVAINCGGDAYLAVDGTSYQADTYYTGGSTYSTGDPIGYTEDDALYQTERYGNVTYSIPITNAEYQVTLHFAEIYFASVGMRIFDVEIEGIEEISSLDVFAEAGHDVAWDVVRTVTVSDGYLTIQLIPDVSEPAIKAITVRSIPEPTPTLSLIHI